MIMVIAGSYLALTIHWTLFYVLYGYIHLHKYKCIYNKWYNYIRVYIHIFILTTYLVRVCILLDPYNKQWERCYYYLHRKCEETEGKVSNMFKVTELAVELEFKTRDPGSIICALTVMHTVSKNSKCLTTCPGLHCDSAAETWLNPGVSMKCHLLFCSLLPLSRTEE